MDLTVNLPDIRGNISFVWPLHEPVALINRGPPVYTDICGNSIIYDLKTKCRPFEQVGPHAKCAMADWIYGTQSPKLFIRT
jgi:hypothetical protein